MVDQDEIIHVTNVMPDAQPLLDKVIQIIQHRQFDQLAGLASQPDAVIPAERINDVRHMLINPVIQNSLPHGCFGRIVGCGGEILGNIALQHPPGIPMLVVVPPKVHAHALVGEGNALPDLAGAVIVDEATCDGLIQIIVAQASLKLPVA